jgi:hypothetical protein
MEYRANIMLHGTFLSNISTRAFARSERAQCLPEVNIARIFLNVGIMRSEITQYYPTRLKRKPNKYVILERIVNLGPAPRDRRERREIACWQGRNRDCSQGSSHDLLAQQTPSSFRSPGVQSCSVKTHAWQGSIPMNLCISAGTIKSR